MFQSPHWHTTSLPMTISEVNRKRKISWQRKKRRCFSLHEWAWLSCKAARGWAWAATGAELGSVGFCVSDGGREVEMINNWWRLALDADREQNWQRYNPPYFLLLDSPLSAPSWLFPACPSLLSGLWLEGWDRHIHECWVLLTELWRRSKVAYPKLHSKSPLTSHEDQTYLLGSWFPVHRYCRTEWASRKC